MKLKQIEPFFKRVCRIFYFPKGQRNFFRPRNKKNEIHLTCYLTREIINAYKPGQGDIPISSDIRIRALVGVIPPDNHDWVGWKDLSLDRIIRVKGVPVEEEILFKLEYDL